ncbi:MAG: hypothetical protein ACT4PU_11775 [Planctomycetota bacterium]
MPEFVDLLPGALVPALLAGALLLLTRWRPAGRFGDWLLALAVGAGYLAGHYVLTGWRGWSPRSAVDWVPLAALLGVVLGGTALTRRAPRALGWVVRITVAGVVAYTLAGPAIRRVLKAAATDPTLLAVFFALALPILLAAVVFWAQERTAVRDETASAVGNFALCLTLSACLGLSGSEQQARLAGALTAAAGAVLVLGWLHWRTPRLAAAQPVFVLVLFALTLAGLHVSELPAASAVLLAAAPLVPALLPQGAAALRSGAWRVGAWAFGGACLVAALGVALWRSPSFAGL